MVQGSGTVPLIIGAPRSTPGTNLRDSSTQRHLLPTDLSANKVPGVTAEEGLVRAKQVQRKNPSFSEDALWGSAAQLVHAEMLHPVYI